jgi:hypothetical protein
MEKVRNWTGRPRTVVCRCARTFEETGNVVFLISVLSSHFERFMNRRKEYMHGFDPSFEAGTIEQVPGAAHPEGVKLQGPLLPLLGIYLGSIRTNLCYLIFERSTFFCTAMIAARYDFVNTLSLECLRSAPRWF